MPDKNLASIRNSFATTRWTLVATAAEKETPEAKAALESLCQSYWMPLYAFARRKTNSLEEAQDLTQTFFVELLEKNYVATATPNRGRFRSFLLTAFKNFISKQWEKNKTQKRGGHVKRLSLDFQTADSSIRIDPASGLTSDQIFDQQWAIALLDQVLFRLQDEFSQSGKTERFDTLKQFVIGDHSGATYADVAQRLELTEAAVKKSVSRMRSRYRELLRDEISNTVANPDEIDDEIRSLFAVLQAN